MYIVYITIDNLDNARKLARIIIKNKLAACVNIIPQIYSVFSQEIDGEVTETNEVILIAKTDKSLLKKLTNMVKLEHPYECPCIMAIKITKVNKEYIKWLETSLKLA